MKTDAESEAGETPEPRSMKCPRCSKDLGKGHSYWSVGVARLDSPEEHELSDLISQQRWEEARRDFHAAASLPEDIRVWQLIRCQDGGTYVARGVLTFDLWAEDSYTLERLLSEQEQARVRQLVGDEWMRF